MLLITQDAFTIITQDALQCYPHECCGFLLGLEENNQRIICEAIVCANQSSAKSNRFVISPQEYKNAEQKAEQKKMSLLGIYHSHPNCEAVPSATDLKAAFPYFSYLIISISDKQITSVRCWQLNDDFLFEEENITHQNKFYKYKQAYGDHHYSYTSA